MSRLLGKAGARQMLVSSRGRCSCRECDVTPDKRTQRAREKRAWRREVETCPDA